MLQNLDNPYKSKVSDSWALCSLYDYQERSYTQLRLKLHHLDVGVRNSCTRQARDEECGDACNILFIQKVVIAFGPIRWAADAHRLQYRPYTTPMEFRLQESSVVFCQIPLDPRQCLVQKQRGRAIQRKALQFGWSATCTDDSRKSVSWIWELYRSDNGRKLKSQNTWTGDRPDLGVRPDQRHFPPDSVDAEELWEQPSAALEQELRSTVKVTVHTAVLPRKGRLPGYKVARGPKVSFTKEVAFS
jgi:hypothetical protein